MSLSVRRFELADYLIICEWWKDWNQPIPSLEILPQNGLIIPNVAALFLYKTDSTLCLVENLVTNKNYREKDRHDLINKLFDEVFLLAKEIGFKHVVSFSENRFVIQRLTKNHQYKTADKFKLLTKEL